MTESISDRVARTILNSSKPMLGLKRVELLAVSNEIRTALNDGCTMRATFETLKAENKISCSYQRFRTFVADHIRERKSDRSEPLAPIKPIPGSETLKQKPPAWNSRPDPREIF